jgi:hypothetical protein
MTMLFISELTMIMYPIAIPPNFYWLMDLVGIYRP